VNVSRVGRGHKKGYAKFGDIILGNEPEGGKGSRKKKKGRDFKI